MERATQNLENDHQHILKLIDVMEEMVKYQEMNTLNALKYWQVNI